jgi:hypothetical protein
MKHETSFDVIRLLNKYRMFVSGIPARLPDTLEMVHELLTLTDEIIGDEEHGMDTRDH